MKYVISILFLSFTLFICKDLTAQNLSKSEVKEIKEELSKFKKNPLLYKLKLQKLRKECDDKDEEINEFEAKLKKNKRAIRMLNDSIALMHNAIDILVEEMEMNSADVVDPGIENTPENPYENLSADNTTTNSITSEPKKEPVTDIPAGTVYKVQVGFFKNFNLTEYFRGPKTFAYEEAKGGYTYNIGYFNSYSEAKKFAEDMKKLGLNDAFVTKYNNGKRTN